MDEQLYRSLGPGKKSALTKLWRSESYKRMSAAQKAAETQRIAFGGPKDMVKTNDGGEPVRLEELAKGAVKNDVEKEVKRPKRTVLDISAAVIQKQIRKLRAPYLNLANSIREEELRLKARIEKLQEEHERRVAKNKEKNKDIEAQIKELFKVLSSLSPHTTQEMPSDLVGLRELITPTPTLQPQESPVSFEAPEARGANQAIILKILHDQARVFQIGEIVERFNLATRRSKANAYQTVYNTLRTLTQRGIVFKTGSGYESKTARQKAMQRVAANT